MDQNENETIFEVPRPAVPLLRIRKFGYNAVLSLLILALIVQTITLAFKYHEGPTFVTTSIIEQMNVSFPSITFCPLSKGYKFEVLKVTNFLKGFILF